jgi:histidyl-tRNA synthetase
MGLLKKPYKGTRDFFPPLKRIQNYLFDHMKKTAEIFGYEPYDGPLLEEVDLYLSKSGEELINEQIFSFVDRGQRNVAIRPEMTPTLARMISQVYREYPRPLRWYSIPNLMRYENTQKGRLREHWQFNCDIFGAPKPYGEIEILNIAISLLNSFGANENHFTILINDRNILNELFQNIIKIDKNKSYKLYKLMDKFDKLPTEVFQKELIEILEIESDRDVFKKFISIKNFDELKDFLAGLNLSKVGENLILIYSKLTNLNLNQYIEFSPKIVRGLDYYTGLVFEIYDKSPENRRALCGGGSYDNLLEIFGEENFPGVGFGLGDVTLKDFLETHNLLKNFQEDQYDFFLAFQNEIHIDSVFKFAQKLRGIGLKTIVHPTPTKWSKGQSAAIKKNVKYFAFLSEQDFENEEFQIKSINSANSENKNGELSQTDSQSVNKFPSKIKFNDNLNLLYQLK